MLDLYKNIRARRMELNMSQADLAAKTGYSGKSMIARIERGDVDLPQSKIMLFAKALDISPGDLMGWDDAKPRREMKFDLFGEPVYEAAAGEGRLNDGYPTDTVALKLEADQKLFRIKGRSMEPTLLDGDLVVVSAQSVIDHPRQMALVKVNGDEHTVKRVEVRSDGVLLIGDNIDVYSPRFFTKGDVEELPVRIEGVVVRLIRDL